MGFINLREHRSALRESGDRKQRDEQALDFQDSRQGISPGRHTTPKKKRAQPRRALFLNFNVRTFLELKTNNSKLTIALHANPSFDSGISLSRFPVAVNIAL
jgi:hypothetical protein